MSFLIQRGFNNLQYLCDQYENNLGPKSISQSKGLFDILSFVVDWKATSKQVRVFSQPWKLGHGDILVKSSPVLARVPSWYEFGG